MKIPICPDLTGEQYAAMDGYFNRVPKRLFYGVTPQVCIDDFRAINELRKLDPARAEAREKQMFIVLRYTEA